MTQMSEEVRESQKPRHASRARETFRFPEVGVPFMWPFAFFEGFEEEAFDAVGKTLSVRRLNSVHE